MDNNKLANMLFPEVNNSVEYYMEKYPKRNLEEGAEVVRFAPSPTGFLHIGGVFTALLDDKIASQSHGVTIIRIEDTDQKREVEGAIVDIIKTMNHYGINFQEGMINETEEIGNYGPYKQSARKDIYQSFAKELVKNGLAYPCFCTEEEINAIREEQISKKLNPGYYGQWAKCRDLSLEDIENKIKSGERFIVRLKSPGKEDNRVVIDDLIRGKVSFPENQQDVVIIKSDGLPTYHFAHAVDDTLMRVTTIIRGEDWLSSLPIHVQLFQVMGLQAPKYAHIPNIMKIDGESKRKLSKRKDPESAVSYYNEQGYPVSSVVEYLLNIINSTFEQWREENPHSDNEEFHVSLDKMSKSGALFDIVKLNDVSKNVICRFKPDRVYEECSAWAKEYDEELFKLLADNEEMCKKVFNIDKEGPKPRKDFAKWSDVKEKIFYFFDELFERDENIELPKNMDIEEAKRIIAVYNDKFNFNSDQDAWFEELKGIATDLGYTPDRKAFKKTPEAFKGMVSDVAGAVRAALTHRSNTPDLYTIMQILGEKKVKERFNNFIK
ncbi:glutamyl-tRNA synthetase [Hathewaya proteolytica DSM 3090]|uniref:Glutamate--tRNA ligase n=1 Tax=Hathewaya proteolytica DSM 3090 TaxID=1121331 RepID=A0A1M6P454_9CLOT|nr:glutamate--tRNA ligase [Hathewaya proteolytica]SHK02682.1 glutamyl-tRNA synthetase [Hathewaya proteolytica DSM 3090]